MNTPKSYCFTADTPTEYSRLATFVAETSCINATLIPLRNAIVVSPKNETSCEVDQVENFIKDEGLVVSSEAIEPNEESMYDLIGEECIDASTLKAVIEMLVNEQRRVNEKQASEREALQKGIADLKEHVSDLKESAKYYMEKNKRLEEKLKVLGGVVESLRYLCNKD